MGKNKGKKPSGSGAPPPKVEELSDDEQAEPASPAEPVLADLGEPTMSAAEEKEFRALLKAYEALSSKMRDDESDHEPAKKAMTALVEKFVELCARSPADSVKAYTTLIDTLPKDIGTHILLLNQVSDDEAKRHCARAYSTLLQANDDTRALFEKLTGSLEAARDAEPSAEEKQWKMLEDPRFKVAVLVPALIALSYSMYVFMFHKPKPRGEWTQDDEDRAEWGKSLISYGVVAFVILQGVMQFGMPGM